MDRPPLRCIPSNVAPRIDSRSSATDLQTIQQLQSEIASLHENADTLRLSSEADADAPVDASDVPISRSELMGVLEQVADGIVVVQPDGHVQWMNREALHAHGFDSNSEARKDFSAYADGFKFRTPDGTLIPPEEWPLNRVLNGDRFSDWTVHVHRLDTNTEWIGHYSGSPLTNERGEVEGGVCTFQKESMSSATGSSPANKKEKELNSLLAEVSHEIRSPLTGIVKLAEILSEKADGEREKRFAPLIEKSSKQLQKTLDAVLSLAKLDANPDSLSRNPIHVPSEVVPLVQTFEPQAESKGLDYSLSVEDTDAPLVASLHSGALASIVQNLLSNAIKYTESGSVQVSICSRLVKGSSMVEIEVSDTGIGISDSFSAQLFNRFAQESSQTNSISKGTGLGLTLVKRFTEKMNGTIDVDSEKGRGSQFRVRFPQLSRQGTRIDSSPNSTDPHSERDT